MEAIEAHDPLLEQFEDLEEEIAERARRRRQEEALARIEAESLERQVAYAERAQTAAQRLAEIALAQDSCEHDHKVMLPRGRPGDTATHQCVDCALYLPPGTMPPTSDAPRVRAYYLGEPVWRSSTAAPIVGTTGAGYFNGRV